MANVFRSDRHLASPILSGEIDYLRTFSASRTGLKKEHRLLLEHHGRDVLKYDEKDFQRHLLQYLCYHTPVGPGYSDLPSAITSALRVYKASLVHTLEPASSDELRIPSPSDLITQELTGWNKWKLWFEQVYKRTGASSKAYMSSRTGGIKVDFFGDLVVVTLSSAGPKRKLLGTYAMWLAVRCIIESHNGALLYAAIADFYGKYGEHKLVPEVSAFLSAGRADLIRLGNKSADVWKAVPSMAIALF